jgi:hypothetical protein
LVKDNLDGGLSWKEPEGWLPGKKQWLEDVDSWEEKNRRAREANRKAYKRKGEKYCAKFMAEIKADEDAKQLRKLRRAQEEEKRWAAYCTRQLEKLKNLNQEQSEKEARWKKYCEEQPRELWEEESMSGSEGHLLAHPNEVKVTLSGDHVTNLVHTLSEGACGDDLATTQEIKENGSEGHFPIHPDEV